ncbi:hypothetical protein DSLPV1_085 [Dishui lake phycodnavirus 1]|uniref:hypothetical protein n=1 Tax=Dishui lake phycodnavirus 1 TaxID=2079134 RepID=UPI000CD6BDB3|nr:hypothetical protein C5Y57_gp085 [Dishui lake phycodnavirus 1]AUT19056.1 hypothetical protein DSLPV1_085 [Dishui lake phycodnavirus 1]
MSAQEQVVLVAQEVEAQSLNSLVGGFAFAAAISWADLARFVVTRVIPGRQNGLAQNAITALLTTLLSVLVFLLVSRFSKRVTKPQQPQFALTR